MGAVFDLVRQLCGEEIDLQASGGQILVKPASLLTTEARAAIRRNKAVLLAELRAQHYQEEFEERAAIIEFDAGLPRLEAGKAAFDCVVTLWLNDPANAPELRSGIGCAACSELLGHDQVPVLRPAGGYISLHSGCTRVWLTRRRLDAAEALRALGLRQPQDWKA